MRKKVNRNTSYRFGVFLLVLILITGINGCKKEWLETKADKRQAVPSTVRDFQAMLDRIGLVNSDYMKAIGEMASDGYYAKESSVNSWALNQGYVQNFYLRAPINPIESQVGNYLYSYSIPYSDILDMNIILNESKKNTSENQYDIDEVRAQALFHRARIFFDIAQTLGVPYNKSTAETDRGIPLRLTVDITESSKRSTIAQTYNQILSDLTNSIGGLPTVPKFLTRASKPAALGMLAKIYLVMGDYKNALKYSDDYINIKSQLLDYNTVALGNSSIGVNKEVSFICFIPQFLALTTDHLIDDELYQSYNEGDLRKKVFFKEIPNGIAFKGFYSNSINDIFAGIATDEIYLIRAECHARLGDLAFAMKDLNDLLRTRWAKNPDGSTRYVDQIATNETEALTKILLERRKELILRGVRWTDLRRLNQEPRFAVTLARTINGQQYTLEPNSDRYTFPFPIEVIQRSNIPQNPGW